MKTKNFTKSYRTSSIINIITSSMKKHRAPDLNINENYITPVVIQCINKKSRLYKMHPNEIYIDNYYILNENVNEL